MKRLSAYFFFFFLIFNITSCTYLHDRHRADYWFASPAPCAQGPFEIRIPARGDAWGEKVTLQIFSPRKLSFRVEWRTSQNEEFYKGYIGTESTMENKECLASETMEKSGGQGGTETPGTPMENAGGPQTGEGGIAPPPETTTAPLQLVRTNPENTAYQSRPAAAPEGSSNSGSSEPPPGLILYSYTLFDMQRKEIEGSVPYPKGTTFIIRLWSTLPNDLRNVRFLVEHRQYKPEPSEEKYIAKLRKEQRERERKIARRHREAERRRQKWLREEEKRRIQASQRPPRPVKPVKVAKTAKPPKPAKFSQTACVTGRYKGRRVQICRKFTDVGEYQKCVADPRDIPCWHVPRKGRWHDYIAETPKPEDQKPQPRPADSAPPPPKAETVPPKPSLNASWVPGYWKWNGFSWVWIYGFWRVPQSDLDAEKTVVAPAEPPAPRNENPEPQPLPEAVWSAGYWHWDGSTWIWVSGRWVVPAQRETIWVPPSWRRTPRGVIFVPGHWRRR